MKKSYLLIAAAILGYFLWKKFGGSSGFPLGGSSAGPGAGTSSVGGTVYSQAQIDAAAAEYNNL
jgi:hypothetical protein